MFWGNTSLFPYFPFSLQLGLPSVPDVVAVGRLVLHVNHPCWREEILQHVFRVD